MQKLDQKQKMQVAGLSVAAVGLFGYFTYQMLQVSPAAAKTQSASAAGQQTKSTLTSTSSSTSTTAAKPATTLAKADLAATATDAPAPTLTMRDPFVPGIADPAALDAYLKSNPAGAKPAEAPHNASGSWNKPSSFVAPLPRPDDGMTLPPARPAEFSATPLPSPAPVAAESPSWTVTGVIQGDDGRIAIMRNGDARRMVHTGDMVDDTYRVVDVSQGKVKLAHGKQTYTIVLGAKPVVPAASPATPTQAMPQANSPQDLGAPATPATGLPQGTVTPGGSTIDPNALIKLPGGLTLPTIHLPAN